MKARFWADIIELGRITIPIDTRKGLDLEKGDRVDVAIFEVKKKVAEEEENGSS